MIDYTKPTPQQVADVLTDFVNGARPEQIEALVNHLGNSHRTLQQAVTGLCLSWLQHLAGLKENQYDLRNQASVEVARSIDSAIGLKFWTRLPYI